MTNRGVNKPVPPQVRLGISAFVVVVGLAYLVLGIVDRNWVQAGLSALVAVSQVVPLTMARRQLGQARAASAVDRDPEPL